MREKVSLCWNGLKVAQMLQFSFNRVENIMRKRRKCWLPAFSPFPAMFSKSFSLSFYQTIFVGWSKLKALADDKSVVPVVVR